MQKQPTAADRVQAKLKERTKDLQKLFRAYQEGDEERHSNDIGTFTDYGLSFDYVAPETFTDQREGYWRYQLSTGGPGDEFRFFSSTPESRPYRIEYWFLDWFDGAHVDLEGDNMALLEEIWEFFEEVGSTLNTYNGRLTTWKE